MKNNNLALFVTHNVFLTEEQINDLLGGSSANVIGHCVPVWVDAKTGKTSEPAAEIFCEYEIENSKEKSSDIEMLSKKGFRLFLPNQDLNNPPPEINFEELASMTSEKRMELMKERDNWWFNNPVLPNVSNLKNGYLRFEIKKTKQKIQNKSYSAQHIIEIARWTRLHETITNLESSI